LRVQWTKTAQKRIAEIEAYIAQDSPDTARKIILSLIKKTAEQLSKYPESGKPGRLVDTRELFFSESPFLVVYTVQNSVVTVLSVFHTSQQYPPSITNP
jgi:addiction module RelE/StbE family toxin